jgi:L-ascorbate metabolism protein UlaG (beta-lactamase superfamily)
MKGTFFGHAAWGLEVGGRRLLVDPNPATEYARAAIDRFAGEAEIVLVTHGAADHLGMTFELLERHPHLRLVSEPAVVRRALSLGVAAERSVFALWNQEHVLGDLRIRALETRHLSVFETSPGTFVSGLPLAFLVRSDREPDATVLHLGDTSIFSDLKLFGELYRPAIALIGIGGAPGYLAEMSPKEGAQAALWLGVDVAVPMHFEADPSAAAEFCEAVRWLPRDIISWQLNPLDSFLFERETRASMMQHGK